MAGGKETPRQKMIGLMYLVLMAMLAMNVSKEVINAFVTLNNKLESSIEQVENSNFELLEDIDKAYATLQSQGAPPAELNRVLMHKNTNDTIVELTRKVCNDIVKRNIYLLISSIDATTTFTEIEGIDRAVIGKPDKNGERIDDPDAKAKAKKLAEKVIALAMIMDDGHGEEHDDHAEHDEYHNPLFHIDEEGYIHIKDLRGYMKKDDYDTPTRLMAGPDFKHIAEEGKHFMSNIQNYRNQLCELIAGHPSDTMENGDVYQFHFDTSKFHNPEFLLSETDRNNFKYEVDSSLALLVKENKIDAADKDVLREVYVRMTIPDNVMNHGEPYPWIFGQFDHAPIVAATAIMTSVRSDVLQVENLASTHIKSRLHVQSFDFNKIDPLAFASTSYINQGDSLGLRVMIAAYDSAEAMELRFWEGDTVQYKLPDSQQDKTLMQTFKGKAGEEVRLGGGVGDHPLYGLIAVKEKGIKKWKPWKFNYSVGTPTGTVANSEMNVLYMQYDNQIMASGSGYPATDATCSGCSLSKKGDGQYIATVRSGKKATIVVHGISQDGSKTEIARQEFRIKRLPDPTPKIVGVGVEASTVKIGKIKQAKKLLAELKGSPLNIKFTITKFTISVVKNGQVAEAKCSGERLSSRALGYIKGLKKGGKLYIEDVYAKGPKGKAKKIPSMILKVI